MKRNPLFILLSSFVLFFFVKPALAICPVCTVAVGAGVGLTRYLGIDDTVSGVWIGGLTVALIIWTNDWMDKKNIRFSGRGAISAAAWLGLVFAPLYLGGIVGHPLNRIYGLDKIIVGVVSGGLLFYISALLYYYLKVKNNGRAHFPFEKVVLTVAPLIILSVFFYLFTK